MRGPTQSVKEEEIEIIFLTFPLANPKGVNTVCWGLAMGMENNFLFLVYTPTHIGQRPYQ